MLLDLVEDMMLMGEILVNGIQLRIKIWARILFRIKLINTWMLSIGFNILGGTVGDLAH